MQDWYNLAGEKVHILHLMKEALYLNSFTRSKGLMQKSYWAIKTSSKPIATMMTEGKTGLLLSNLHQHRVFYHEIPYQIFLYFQVF